MKCTGFEEFLDIDNKVWLQPITSRGTVSNACILQVPEEDWYGAALDAVLDQKGLVPQLMGLHPCLDKMIEERLKT